jgi:hypothetical protein
MPPAKDATARRVSSMRSSERSLALDYSSPRVLTSGSSSIEGGRSRREPAKRAGLGCSTKVSGRASDRSDAGHPRSSKSLRCRFVVGLKNASRSRCRGARWGPLRVASHAEWPGARVMLARTYSPRVVVGSCVAVRQHRAHGARGGASRMEPRPLAEGPVARPIGLQLLLASGLSEGAGFLWIL